MGVDTGTGTMLDPVQVWYGARIRYAAEVPGRALGRGRLLQRYGYASESGTGTVRYTGKVLC